MASNGTRDYAKMFGKGAIEFGDKAWAGYKPEAWQPLGIKDGTAMHRANSKGVGGTRSAMLACMIAGFEDMALATQAAAYLRMRHLGNTQGGTGGISYGWFTVYANMATVASNATFSADSKGTYKLRATVRKSANKAPKAPKATADRSNSEVRVVRKSDAELAATADMATVEGGA